MIAIKTVGYQKLKVLACCNLEFPEFKITAGITVIGNVCLCFRKNYHDRASKPGISKNRGYRGVASSRESSFPDQTVSRLVLA